MTNAPSTPNAHGSRPAASSKDSRGFRTILFAICGAVLFARLLMLREYWTNNPFARLPIADGMFYWDLAKRYATGHLLGDTPFLSAPLYPYFLGIIRALGGGLIATYVIQIGCHLATGVTLAWIGKRRHDALVGLLAAVTFFLVMDSAVACFRVLSSSVQLMSVVLTWAVIVWAQDRPSAGRWGFAGVALGLTCLTNGSLILLAPPLAAWLLARESVRASGLRHSAALLLGCAAALAPATLHNYKACGEFIPMSAHSGLTLRHGNAPGANGTYLAAEGVAAEKHIQHLDAFRVYERETGEHGTWRAVDRYFAGLAVRFWRDDPVHAVKLAARKAYWFLTARNYGDMYLPSLEAASGIDRLFYLAPLPVAMLIPLALVAAMSWLKSWRTHGPELLMLCVPWLVVTVFWYSPRYRLPAVPVIAMGAAWIIGHAFRGDGRAKMRVVATFAILVAIGLQLLNRAIPFDSADGVRTAFHLKLGQILDVQERGPEAMQQYKLALRTDPNHPEAHHTLGTALLKRGDPTNAISHLRAAADRVPLNARYQAALGTAYVQTRQFDEAERYLEAALRINPDDRDAHFNLAGALMFDRRFQDAARHYREVLRIDPDALNAWFFLPDALARSGDRAAAASALRKGIEHARAMGKPDEALTMERKLRNYDRP